MTKERIAELRSILHQAGMAALSAEGQHWYPLVAECLDAIEVLQAENEALRNDSARLDWLDLHSGTATILTGDNKSCGWRIQQELRGEDIRQSIDAAMQKPTP